MYNWYTTTDCCPVRLPRQSVSWRAHRSRKEWAVLAEILIYRRGRRTLLNAVFTARLDNVFMEKKGCENFRDGESLERYLCIWRCQNRYERANDRENTVKRYLDGLYGPGTLRFYGLLSFQLDFQLQIPVLAIKMRFLERDARFFLAKSGATVLRR